MKKFLLAVICMFSLTSFACAADEAVDVESTRKLSRNVDALNWKYFATLNRDENIFYSPYGIAAAVSILANGAEGETLRGILHALAAEDVAALNDAHKNFSALVEKNYHDENFFAEANLLLVNRKIITDAIGKSFVHINKDFRRVVEDVYKSDVRTADFEDDIDGERKKISRWVADKTNGFIADYDSIVTAATITDLLNVVYFKGKWQFPFDERNTAPMNFTGRDGAKVTADMMCATFNEAIAYVADEKFRAIKLPYSAAAAMYVIMPADENALDVAERWNAESFDYREKFLAALKKSAPFDGKVIVRLPKFDLDIENSLVENFKAMGLARAFTDDAELTNIVNNMRLKIGNAKHRAKVTVDEQGTEAAAVTEITTLETTAVHDPRPRVVRFYAERPFLFVIGDVESDVTLFAGVVNKLKATQP